MHQNLASTVQCFFNESICETEVLLCVFLRLIVDLQVQVLEVALALRVGLAAHVEDVCASDIDELTGLESPLEWTHVDASIDLEQDNVSDSLGTIHVVWTEIDVREATADHCFFFGVEGSPSILHPHTGLLFVERWSTDDLTHGLELRDGDSVNVSSLLSSLATALNNPLCVLFLNHFILIVRWSRFGKASIVACSSVLVV